MRSARSRLRAVHAAVFHEHVADAARNFAADGDAAVAVLHAAVADDHVLARRVAPAGRRDCARS